MKSPIATAIAIAVGLVVLIGYLVPVPVFLGLRLVLLQWAAILAGIALLVGMVNLSQHHWHNVRERQGMGGSTVLLISLWATFAIVLYASPRSAASQWIFSAILLPGSIALMALLAFTLAYAGVRLLRRRPGLFSILFLSTAALVLLGAATFPGIGALPVISDTLRPWLIQVPAAAGARGILLGVALGTVATGLRILLGNDRPYGE